MNRSVIRLERPNNGRNGRFAGRPFLRSLLPLWLAAACWLAGGARAGEFFSPGAATWKLFRGQSEASSPAGAWREAGFNDGGWEDAPAPVYYSTAGSEPPFFSTGASFTGTRVQDMLNAYSCVFLRKAFQFASVTNIEELTLTAACDDGFIAWINGHEVARYNVPDGDLSYDDTAFDAPVEPVPFVVFPIGKVKDVLVDGVNILAVQAFNRALDSSDFGFMAGLSWTIPLPPVADTQFDHDRGLYQSAFDVAITCPTPGAVIYYTLDGSSPSSANGQAYVAPIAIRGTTVLRARAEKAGFKASNVDTHTYLFLADVVDQAASGAAPPGWPKNWGGNKVDYGMDPDITKRAPWSAQMETALKSIPTLSLVTDLTNLFDEGTGIYANASGEGRAWERPGSLELLLPSGTNGFQENCGVRIRGGFSRSADDPKHSFRFYFRSEYGTSKLHYPLFGPARGNAIDQFDLRTSQDGSWAYLGARDGFFLNDPFARDTLLALGQPSERGDFYHLYINGQYWGLYNSCERPEASYAATYFGGEEEEYDVLKPDPQSGYVMVVTDGNDLAWTELWRAAVKGFASNADYYAVQGRDPDGAFNPARTNLLDVVNLVDYLFTIYWTGNYDGPLSGDLNNGFLNNYYAFRSRQNKGGFRFIAHDSELSLGSVDENRTGTSTRGDPSRGDGADQLNPYYLWTRLSAHPEFKQLVADRIQKHFFNGGALTTEASTARFRAREAEIALAVIAESARWGDAQHSNDPITPDEWREAIDDKLANYFPKRSAVVLKQLRARGFWPPAVSAPRFSSWGGEVSTGTAITLTHTNAVGEIFVTMDRSDPRLPGGAVSSKASVYQAAVGIDRPLLLRARVKSGDKWSPLIEAEFYPKQDFHSLTVSEIMFHPPALNGVDGDQFEFVELKNRGTATLDLTGVRFTSGIHFDFTNGTILLPGHYFVLARSAPDFLAKYPGIELNGVYTGKLDNSGDLVILNGPGGQEILSFKYGDAVLWPDLADGKGFSLVLAGAETTANLSDPHSWRASLNLGGSPASDDLDQETPRLKVAADHGSIVLAWSGDAGSLVLESAPAVGPGAAWSRVPLENQANSNSVRVNSVQGTGARFFRLRK